MSRVIVLAVLAAGVAAWLAGSSWSYHHPWALHDCRMLASLCASHYAEWVPNGGSVPLYGKCACAATLTVHGGSR